MKEDFEAYLKSRQYSSRTIETYLVSLGRYLEWLERENIEVEQVTYNDLLLYMKHQSKSVSQRGLAGYMLAVKHFYHHLMREKKVTTNPAEDIQVKGVKRKILYHILAPHELHQLYNAYPGQSISEKRKKVMLGLMGYQGLKTEELKKLEVKDVKLREGQLTVPGGRRSNGRTMTLEPHQIMDMYDYVLQVRPELLKRISQTTDNLLVIPKDNGYISNLVTELMKKLKEINSNVLNPNQIRASVITKWIKMYNLREVQYLAGHRYISSTEWYLENDLEGLQEEINQYHPLG
ncbi:MAG: tyrosine-type recombinase/integrase [Bacteroidota bacterium]